MVYKKRLKERFCFHPKIIKTLTEHVYNKILRDREGGVTFKKLSEKYGICETYINDICCGNLSFLKKFKSYRVVKNSPGKITYKGESLSVPEWSEKTGINIRTLYYRIKQGWGTKEIFKTF
jgi:hypothetical protein